MGYLISGHMSANYTPSTQPKDEPPTEHRCPNCYTPGFGKSSIRCKNEPVTKRDQMHQEGMS